SRTALPCWLRGASFTATRRERRRRSRNSDKSLARRQVQVHRLDADPSRAGESIPDHSAAAAEDAGLEPEHLDLHPNGLVALDPATGLDVDLLVWCQLFLEDVAVAVQPEDALLVRGAEAIDEEPGGTEEHVADALHPVEGVVEIAGRRQELVLSHEHRGPGRQVERKEMAGAIAGKRDLARPLRLGKKNWHAGNHALECPLHRPNGDAKKRLKRSPGTKAPLAWAGGPVHRARCAAPGPAPRRCDSGCPEPGHLRVWWARVAAAFAWLVSSELKRDAGMRGAASYTVVTLTATLSTIKPRSFVRPEIRVVGVGVTLLLRVGWIVGAVC